MLITVLSAVHAALTVPLMPAPSHYRPPCATFRYYPGECDGVKQTAVVTVRSFATTVEAAALELSRVRHALVGDGDEGKIGEADNPLLVREIHDRSTFGFVRGTSAYFMQASFHITGRA